MRLFSRIAQSNLYRNPLQARNTGFYHRLPFGDNVGYSDWIGTRQAESIADCVRYAWDVLQTDNRRSALILLPVHSP